jgi:hypothetical protein
MMEPGAFVVVSVVPGLLRFTWTMKELVDVLPC